MRTLLVTSPENSPQPDATADEGLARAVTAARVAAETRGTDLVVLDRDYLTVPADQIKDIKPVMTMIGGRTVFGGL